MARMFDPILIDTHDLYHARYGRGAVMVAVRRDSGEACAPEPSRQDIHAVRLFHASEQAPHSATPPLDPVLSLREEDGLLRVTVQFEHRNRRNPAPEPVVSATIERAIPLDQITLEIVRTSDAGDVPRSRRGTYRPR